MSQELFWTIIGVVVVGFGGLMATIIGAAWMLRGKLSDIEIAIEHLKGEIASKASDSDVRKAIREHVKDRHMADRNTPAFGVDIPRV